MARPVPIFEVPYQGGATAYTGELDHFKQNVQLTAQGFLFGGGGVVLKVLPVGAAEPETVTVDSPKATIRLLDTALVSVEISGLAAVDPEDAYKITAYQF